MRRSHATQRCEARRAEIGWTSSRDHRRTRSLAYRDRYVVRDTPINTLLCVTASLRRIACVMRAQQDDALQCVIGSERCDASDASDAMRATRRRVDADDDDATQRREARRAESVGARIVRSTRPRTPTCFVATRQRAVCSAVVERHRVFSTCSHRIRSAEFPALRREGAKRAEQSLLGACQAIDAIMNADGTWFGAAPHMSNPRSSTAR